MPDFQRVKSPFFTPTRCATCLSHKDKDGFVDLLVDTPINGRLYMCATCLYQAGRKMGMLDPESAERLGMVVQEVSAHAEYLTLELEREKENKVVSLKDARKLLGTA